MIKNKLIILFVGVALLSGCTINQKSTANGFYLEDLPDNPIYTSSEYKNYMHTIRNIIAKNAVDYSYSIGSGSVKLAFQIKYNGKLKRVRIDHESTKASKITINDAIRALKKSSPFPPFPEGLKKEYKVLTFTTLLEYGVSYDSNISKE